MNKIYALKYSVRQGALVPVSELATHVKKSSRTGLIKKIIPSLLINTILLGYSVSSLASVVRYDLPYQTIRDFSENKGQFTPGSLNIPIYNKTDAIIGYLNKAPMPDFSSANHQSAVATLVSPQYIVSVKHNGGYQSVSFGDGENKYRLVDRNNQPGRDFHTPRLNKLVTEVEPSLMTQSGMVSGAYSDKNRYPTFYRIGSGTQEIKQTDGQIISLSGAYNYLTGGTAGSLGSYAQGQMISANTNKQLYNLAQGPMGTHPRSGDSGSPLFAYDSVLQQWVIVGVDSSGGGGGTNWTVVDADFVNQSIQEDTDAPVTFVAGQGALRWAFDSTDGTGTLTQQETVYQMHGQKDADLNAGKNLVFNGADGQIVLEDSVNQGAGALTFNGNYTVSTNNGSTWQGAGLDISRDAEVIWQVNGVQGDNLHKIGEGVLKVNGTGINPGGLKVGDGTVILAQRPDEDGKAQAFSSVNIASGRPTVVLTDSRQVNPDNISWGVRGGRLDINGNDVTFHKLNAADNGANIINASDTFVTVSIKPITDMTVTINDWDKNKASGGAAGLLYKYNNPYAHTVDYFIQKRKGYGFYPVNQSDNDSWEYVGHNETQAIEQVKSRRPVDDRMYHGNLAGNIDLNIDTSRSSGGVIFDGNIDTPEGGLMQSGGQLTFQGHPVIHAYNNKGVADKLKSLGDDSVRTQPTSFDQPDWEGRTFRLKTLLLKNTDFGLARNASLHGDIEAVHSSVTLGTPNVYIDLNDGNGTKVTPQKGTSVAGQDTDMSRYAGKVTLGEQSTLDVREIFTGSIQSQDSAVTVSSRHATLDDYSRFGNTSLALQEGARLTATGGWWSDSDVIVGPAATLSLAGTSVTGQPGQVSPAFYSTDYGAGYQLDAGSQLHFSPYTFVTGDIRAKGDTGISIGGEDGVALADNLPLGEQMMYSLFNGFRNVYSGNVSVPQGRMTMTDTQWQMPGDSHTGALRMIRSLAGFTGRGFNSLTTNTLQANQSAFALRTDLKDSDKIVVNQKAEGRDNTLFVNFLKKPSGQEPLNIPLVSAPAGTNPAMFKAAERVTGFSLVTPTLHTIEQDGKIQWVLDGFKSAPDKGSATSANSFMGMGYKNFMTEVNNLNKRMGDLRDTQGEDGMWVRIMNGAGTGDAGYSDRYTHLQTGFDKKHRLSGADLFTGVLMSYTDSSASGRAYSGDTHSLGGGMYASVMFDSGIYMDVIGKYIHHDNDYNAGFAGLGKRNYGTHSWYAGLEGGYRYRLTESLYIEPQAELVYGTVSGTTLKWNDNGMDVSMRSKTYNPLIGRTGVALGKTFSGKDWSVTARTGVDYQFDLVANGETALRDASGEKRFTGEKDSRMLYNVGLNAQVKDNVRFGLELEQSAFGKYNVDHAINANFRYMF
ncbi:autotransporter outer membrane beta-barrel domain-containing protein [Salmonella enterica subsp. enterica serovar Louisiana]|uniref:Autotransporter outer membrane beta-barrel domain-containing protein n=1 Tax=Salmonella enteritidis TaxID=149539 RepID=A0A5V0B9V0_SALEN|nr:autotransporter outer membrane beta-barrel domain-containing protein [Salmonella enterica subsp. enterica serovar Louisiana]EBS5459185.1 autotransporter outer membrane beta-barrel domain-containing protein [Salmonella enterica subsp. enterica serovar Enteritidis]EBW7766416.1 autotransporter outer membrane beta-barrel domain-containing protein [Salmonella enterica subsp. enterica serovar Louisiana]EDA7582723.1 autotransporter outer membrane beta-barrel domain-containing protein [Salmonella ent